MSIYRTALEVQDASNLSGIVYQFARDMQIICEEIRRNGGGTNAINRHPVCRMYAEQIAWLAGAGSCANHRSYLRAHDACERLATEPQPISDGEAGLVS
jgi:hypothetical protein